MQLRYINIFFSQGVPEPVENLPGILTFAEWSFFRALRRKMSA